ncbi:MAG: hypothetical protein IPI69_16095 [Bacteroidales bacterium]|nr:hypothetical protein [Bacteroidales bacterium]
MLSQVSGKDYGRRLRPRTAVLDPKPGSAPNGRGLRYQHGTYTFRWDLKPTDLCSDDASVTVDLTRMPEAMREQVVIITVAKT